MPKAKPNPELVAQARELVAMGASLREAATTLGVTAPTIKRWIESEPAEIAPLAPAELPAHMKPPEATPLAELDMSDPRKMVEQLIRGLYQQLQGDVLSGNTRQFGSLAATLSKLTVSLRQFAEQEQSAADGTLISAAEVERIKASLAERVRANCARPLLCAECSRELSVFWGTGLTEAALNADSAANDHSKKPD